MAEFEKDLQSELIMQKISSLHAMTDGRLAAIECHLKELNHSVAKHKEFITVNKRRITEDLPINTAYRIKAKWTWSLLMLLMGGVGVKLLGGVIDFITK